MKKTILLLLAVLSFNSFAANYYFKKGAPAFINEAHLEYTLGWDIGEDFSYLFEDGEEILEYCKVRRDIDWDDPIISRAFNNAQYEFSFSTLYKNGKKYAYVAVMVVPMYFTSRPCYYKRGMMYLSLRGKDITNYLTSAQYDWVKYNSPISFRR